MKRILLVFLIVFLSSTAYAKDFHLFFIAQEQTFNVEGTDYNAWVIDADGTDYYFMRPGTPRPEGYTIRDIVGVMASSGANDMIYYYTTKLSEAAKASLATEYAGGSNTSTASAYLLFTILSYEQKGIHSTFPAAAAVKAAIPCRWKVADVWQNGTVGDWIDAGYPMDSLHCDVSLRIFGIE